MARVDFNGITVDVDDATMQNPQALAQIANAVKFQHGADETTGAPAALRFAIGSATQPEDQIATLKAKGLDAGFVGDALYYRDEAGKSRRVNPQGLDWGDVAGAAPEIAEAAGATLGAIGGGVLGNVPGAVLGSATGAVAGREGAQWVGRQAFGTQDTRSAQDRLVDVGQTAALGAAGEGVGQLAGHGVRAFRTAMTPSVESRIATEVGQAINAPVTAGMATNSAVLRGAEDIVAGSRFGQGTLENAATAQNKALGTALDDLTRTDGGWQVAGIGQTHPDLVSRAAAASKEIPSVEPVNPVRSSWPDEFDQLIRRGSISERQQFARSTLTELGGGSAAFDANVFIRNWDALDPRAKYTLGQVEGVGKELAALAPVIRKAAEYQARTGKNPATPLGSILNVLGIGGSYMAGGAGAAVGAAVAPAVVAKLMTSPRFVRWLSKVPRNPGSFTRHLGRLATMAEGDEDVGALVEALGRQ